jgi:hypothetical protein
MESRIRNVARVYFTLSFPRPSCDFTGERVTNWIRLMPTGSNRDGR